MTKYYFIIEEDNEVSFRLKLTTEDGERIEKDLIDKIRGEVKDLLKKDKKSANE